MYKIVRVRGGRGLICFWKLVFFFSVFILKEGRGGRGRKKNVVFRWVFRSEKVFRGR